MSRITRAERSLFRPFYTAYKSVVYGLKLPYLRFLDRYRLNDINSIYDEEYFQKRQEPPYSIIAKEFVEELVTRYNPESAIDIGCAIGVCLNEFEKRGIDVAGIEGAQRAVDNALVSNIRQVDLRNEVTIEDTADLVMCIEVAEHLHPIYADGLATTIASGTAPGGIAIVSAAEPGQFGTYHLNLQRKDYWIDRFDTVGLDYDPTETMRLQSAVKERLAKSDVSWIAASNLMVFQK